MPWWWKWLHLYDPAYDGSTRARVEKELNSTHTELTIRPTRRALHATRQKRGGQGKGGRNGSEYCHVISPALSLSPGWRSAPAKTFAWAPAYTPLFRRRPSRSPTGADNLIVSWSTMSYIIKWWNYLICCANLLKKATYLHMKYLLYLDIYSTTYIGTRFCIFSSWCVVLCCFLALVPTHGRQVHVPGGGRTYGITRSIKKINQQSREIFANCICIIFT